MCRLLNHMRARDLSECVPRNTDGAVEEGTLLGLNAGYIKRSAHLLPKQGSKQPWRIHQSYLRDYRSLKLAPVEDGYMQFRAGGVSGTRAGSEGGSVPAVSSSVS